MDPKSIHEKIIENVNKASVGRKNTGPSEHIPGVLRVLALRGIPFRLIEANSSESSKLNDWTAGAFPFIHSQIDWSKVPTHRCFEWRDIDDLVMRFQELLALMSTQTLVTVTWANALCPSLEMELAGVARIAKEIFEEHETSIDVHVFSLSDGWLIEMHHEGTLCIGYSVLTDYDPNALSNVLGLVNRPGFSGG